MSMQYDTAFASSNMEHVVFRKRHFHLHVGHHEFPNCPYLLSGDRSVYAKLLEEQPVFTIVPPLHLL